jgi:hypothetical protein
MKSEPLQIELSVMRAESLVALRPLVQRAMRDIASPVRMRSNNWQAVLDFLKMLDREVKHKKRMMKNYDQQRLPLRSKRKPRRP